MSHLRALALLAVSILALSARAEWPQFRGPNGSGIDSAAGYPTEFSPSKNVVWKTAAPFGQSSPVVAGGRVYLTASEKNRLLTLCLDANTGRELWRREIRPARSHKMYAANDPASPTPAADEAGVVVFFADFGLAAYTPDGKERWTLPLGPFENFYGMAASPILTRGLVVLSCDQQRGSFVVAVDRETGRPRWKTPRAAATVGWATPMVYHPTGGEPQLVILGSNRLDAYALESGEPRWWTPVASMGALGTPIASGDTLLVSTLATSEPWMPALEGVLAQYDKDKDGRLSLDEFKGDPYLGEHFGFIDANKDGFLNGKEWNEARSIGIGDFGVAAIQPGTARGRLDSRTIRWRFVRNLPFVPAPLAYNGVVYMVKDGGIITSLDLATGKLLKEGRTRGALGTYYASPVAADNKVFLASGEGKVTVLKAAGQWEVLGVNEMGEEVHATPALTNGRIFLRTRSAVYCFGAAR